MEITTEYYADSQVANQTQNGKTYKYAMDPAGRVRETKTEVESKITGATISHYPGPGSAVSWTSEEEGKAWTRNIPGIDGTLTGLAPSTGTVNLQIHDLQGNTVETASDLETETKPLTSYNSTEFGAPLNGAPPTKYTWLGAAGVSSESGTGTITQDGITYVPQIGRSLQTQAVDLPIPDNQATAYVSMIEPGVAMYAASAAAQQVANAQQAKQALEEAGLPSGRVPLGGSEILNGNCSGGGACTSARKTCELHWLLGEPFGGELWLAAHMQCTFKVTGIKVEACFWAWNGKGSTENNKNYGQFECSGKHEKGEESLNTKALGTLTRTDCAEGWSYKSWVYGYAWAPDFWAIGTKTSEAYKCDDAPYGTEREFFKVVNEFMKD
jgi:hypothetical protein